MQNGLRRPDRLQAVLDFWFTESWDRNSSVPAHLMPRWFGIHLDPSSGKTTPITQEEQLDIDEEMRALFSEDLRLSALKTDEGYFNTWSKDPQGILGLVILQDQMARNIFRKKAEAFDYRDALDLALGVIKAQKYKEHRFYERVFLYVVLEHSEDLDQQRQCLWLMRELSQEYGQDSALRKLADMHAFYAEQHLLIIERFGRFPHRNEVLMRVSTEEEVKFLKEGGARFGQ